MIRNRLYYRIKPLLPWSLRIGLRRFVAAKKRPRLEGVWPIKVGSERPPEGWRGWPDGKRFALVLTHDVEGRAGYEKLPKLMALEKRFGFHSSFNLIPEGTGYTVTPERRRELRENGFEVGVHDLHHDGRLFLTDREFHRNAGKINAYLRDWGAVGFRSGFMLHNLDWLHELQVLYDASTFDTDPFEPQPEGRNTIFPFWVARNGRLAESKESPGAPLPVGGTDPVVQPSTGAMAGGYVELPYTLPQDSTLFLVMQERHPDIWFQKLDWVARHGGMALVNVHPDYTRFEGEPASGRTYPVEFYSRFLEYARKQYGDSFWQPLPAELARFVARVRPRPRSRPRRICMLTHSFYTSDARVTRYAEALAERGDHVDVIALKRSPNLPERETVGQVNLIRLQPRFAKNEKSRLSYLLPVVRFLISSSLWITRQHARKRYDLLHIHNVPDFLVFAGWYPKLTGARVILDIHDIVPEFYTSKFGSHPNSKAVTLLKWLEWASARFADHVIIANHLWRDKYATRTGANGKCSVFINNVDERIFRPQPQRQPDGKVLVLFPGGLQWHQGLDIAIRAFQRVVAEIPSAEFHIYGDGNMKTELIALAQQLGLGEKVRFFTPVGVRQIARIMAEADLGVVPKRADSFGNEAYSTKIMEFMSLGVPVVVSSTKIDRYYFNDAVVRFFESGNCDALAGGIIEVLRNKSLRERMVSAASDYAARNSWESRRTDYLDLVDSLVEDRPVPASVHGVVRTLPSGSARASDCLEQNPKELATR